MAKRHMIAVCPLHTAAHRPPRDRQTRRRPPATVDAAISGSPAYIPEERRRRRWIWTPSRPSNVARRLDKDDGGDRDFESRRNVARHARFRPRIYRFRRRRRRPVIDGACARAGRPAIYTNVIESSLTSLASFEPFNHIGSHCTRSARCVIS